MVLADTSVWVAHFRNGEPRLEALLGEGRVACHPFIIGEMACGGLANRAKILGLLRALPRAIIAGHEEVLSFVDRNGLAGKGLGWIDAHLLASARLTETSLWTFDARLREAAEKLGVAFR
jgi:predicted nucleic acid-binding protein